MLLSCCRNAREKNPVYLLNVVQDDDEVKEKVLLTNRNMEKAIKHAAETETRLQLLTRVDLNLSSGISRAVKEMLISDVIINWDDKNTRNYGYSFQFIIWFSY